MILGGSSSHLANCHDLRRHAFYAAALGKQSVRALFARDPPLFVKAIYNQTASSETDHRSRSDANRISKERKRVSLQRGNP